MYIGMFHLIQCKQTWTKFDIFYKEIMLLLLDNPYFVMSQKA